MLDVKCTIGSRTKLAKIIFELKLLVKSENNSSKSEQISSHPKA